jgi:hypothetical protein
VNHHVTLVIDDALQVLGRESKQVGDLVREALEEPDVYNGYNKTNVAHALATNLLLGYLDTTTVTYNTLITDTLVLATVTFVILYWAKNALTEKTISFRLVGTVVNGLGLKHLTIAAFQDIVRGTQADSDGVKVLLLDATTLFECHISFYKEAF